MKQLFTLILLFTIGLTGFAQIVSDPNTLSATISEDEKKEISMTVTNTGDVTYGVWWKLVVGDDWPSEWKTFICDSQNCYTPNTYDCPKENLFAPNASSNAWSVKVDPSGVKGSSTLVMEFYSESSFTNLIGTTEVGAVFTADSDLTSSSKDIYTGNLVLFPNPTQDYFSIKNDENIVSVSLVNVIGKEIWTKDHSTGALYDVSNLFKGMYLVRLMNAKGQLIKTLRLNKTSL
jgi:hypothetical protein